jgi:hypothetical protein
VISLVGVPGRSYLDIDARLGCREGGKGGACIEVADKGVKGPPTGVSVLGVEATRKTFAVPVRDNEGWIWATGGVVADRGNADEDDVTADLGVSGTPTALLTGFEEIEMFVRPGGRLFSLDFVTGWDTETVPVRGVIVFLFDAADEAVFIGVEILAIIGVCTGFTLLLSNAGKSSGWRVEEAEGTAEDCKAIAFDRPVAAADVLTSFFACDIDLSFWELAIFWVGAVGINTLARGVATLGACEATRDGVKVAEVGSILDCDFGSTSSVDIGDRRLASGTP